MKTVSFLILAMTLVSCAGTREKFQRVESVDRAPQGASGRQAWNYRPNYSQTIWRY